MAALLQSAERYCEINDGLVEKLRRGFMNIAKARRRHTNSLLLHSLSPEDVREELVASVGVSISELPGRFLLTSLGSPHDNSEEMMESGASSEKKVTLRRRAKKARPEGGDDDGNDTDSSSDDEDDDDGESGQLLSKLTLSEDSPKFPQIAFNDPIHLFNAFPPPHQLKAAQSDFKSAFVDIIALANRVRSIQDILDKDKDYEGNIEGGVKEGGQNSAE